MLDLVLAAAMYAATPAPAAVPAPTVAADFCIPLSDGGCVYVPDASVPDWARHADLRDPYGTSPGVPRPHRPYNQQHHEDGTSG